MLVIRDSRISDCWELARTIRPADEAECLALGAYPDTAISSSLHKSVYSRTALWDDEIACMWGVCGNLFGQLGQPWFLTGERFLDIPTRTMIKIYKQEVADMGEMFPILTNIVDARYTGAIRLLQITGFDLEGPYEIGNDRHEFYLFKKVRE